jgi:hypothetical protein
VSSLGTASDPSHIPSLAERQELRRAKASSGVNELLRADNWNGAIPAAKCPSENWLSWRQKLAVIRALSLELWRRRSLTSGNVVRFELEVQ